MQIYNLCPFKRWNLIPSSWVSTAFVTFNWINCFLNFQSHLFRTLPLKPLEKHCLHANHHRRPRALLSPRVECFPGLGVGIGCLTTTDLHIDLLFPESCKVPLELFHRVSCYKPPLLGCSGPAKGVDRRHKPIYLLIDTYSSFRANVPHNDGDL